MNIYRRLVDLLPRRPLQVGTVISLNNGVTLIEMPGGGLLKARGTATVGQRVFVRDGLVEGAAPNLPVETIEV